MPHKDDTNRKPETKHQTNINMYSGLLAGTICAGLFHPWDRALYLSVKHKRVFLNYKNHINPWHGLQQTIFQRSVLGSVYYIMQGEMRAYLYPYLHDKMGFNETVSQFGVGLGAGCVYGLTNNWASAIKYETWSHKDQSFFSSARTMWQHGGMRPFIKGTSATVGRDLVFGTTYEVLRHLLHAQILKLNKDRHQESDQQPTRNVGFVPNSMAAGVATLASSPLNYVRNIQYATPPHMTPPTTAVALKNAWRQSTHLSHVGKLKFFQQRFRIGWGTARVTVGMAAGQLLFDTARSILNDSSSTTPRND